jgi:hypothetical protein
MGIEAYDGFDPGHTTGYARIALDTKTMTYEVLDMEPIALNDGSVVSLVMDRPPIRLFEHALRQVEHRLEIDDCNYELRYPSIEDFIGGLGGDVQNTVNKMIGLIMGKCFALRRLDSRLQAPKVYVNSQRRRYLVQARESASKYSARVSHHSIDALAHVLHRVRQEHSAEFSEIRHR